MTKTRLLCLFSLSFGLLLQALAQAPGTPAEQPDQISRLAEAVGLSEAQESEIRGILAEAEPKIEALQSEARDVQAELVELTGPDFDADAIREKAADLGALEGKVTAASLIMQSKIDAVFTEEQRNELQALQQQQQQRQQQMRQMQMQQMQQQ